MSIRLKSIRVPIYAMEAPYSRDSAFGWLIGTWQCFPPIYYMELKNLRDDFYRVPMMNASQLLP